ncbi:hypothetical protein EYC84_010882 [Monilinia fructicola]|uniref:Uncharacterized protein n=1 Tax=Monilinia fructicola TaxID=38448 RepID=A0A5M9JD35_MONFR|nr:hypothetical protein EYC84_010882 [Monilinia fructicola]
MNVKKSGKGKAWGSWLLLIGTSIPVHFLANSVIGPSFYIEMPTNITYLYNETFTFSSYQSSSVTYQEPYESACWTAFRAGLYVLPSNLSQLSEQYNTDDPVNSTSFKTVAVTYNHNCTAYRGTATVEEAQGEINFTVSAWLLRPHKVAHRCHKHCKDPVPSLTGDDIGHCQDCKKFNDINKAADLQHPSIAIKYKKSLLSNLGSTAIMQMMILMFCSFAMVGISIMLITLMASTASEYNYECGHSDKNSHMHDFNCDISLSETLKEIFGTWGGFSSSVGLASLPPDQIGSELMAFAISNGAQFLFSLLYLLLIYNITLISMEHEWGTFERRRRKPRATIVSGIPFDQSYFLQLPSKVLFPLMTFAAAMHWLLGESTSTVETIYTDKKSGLEHSVYFVTYAAYPIFLSTVLMVGQTVICWWAFTYKREGFVPQMYGSIRARCASTSELEDFGRDGIQWGDWRACGL